MSSEVTSLWTRRGVRVLLCVFVLASDKNPLGDVHIIALLSARSRTRLASAFPDLAIVDSWSSLANVLLHHSAAVVIIDATLSPHIAQELREARRRYPMVEFILYSALEPEGMRRCVEAAQAGIADIAIAGYDDTRDRLTAIIEQSVLKSRGATAAAPFGSLLEQLPAPLHGAVLRMFRSPVEFHTTDDLARAAGMSRRGVYRSLKSSGIRSGRRLIAAARVMAAYHLLHDARLSAQETADRLGYSSVGQLSAHLAELANCTSRDVQRGIPHHTFSAKVIDSLCKSTREPARLAVFP